MARTATHGFIAKFLAGFGRPGDSPPATNVVGPPSLQGDHIVVTRPVIQDGARLGSVYLRTVREPFVRRAAPLAVAAQRVTL